ncbi:MAG: hypothetical protein WAO83_09120 [Fuerstiella sp.]
MKKNAEHHVVTYATYVEPNESSKLNRGNRVLGWWFVDRAVDMSASRDVSYRVEFCHPQHRPL